MFLTYYILIDIDAGLFFMFRFVHFVGVLFFFGETDTGTLLFSYSVALVMIRELSCQPFYKKVAFFVSFGLTRLGWILFFLGHSKIYIYTSKFDCLSLKNECLCVKIYSKFKTSILIFLFKQIVILHG